RILAEVEHAETLMRDRRGTVSGVLRVTAPGELGRLRIAPLIAAFQQRHPQLTVQLMLTDTVVDLLAADIDVAVRIGNLADSTMIARELAPNHRVLCASPDYLARRGTPRSLADLASHDCLAIKERDHPFGVWRLTVRGET
ncbi:LysR substrate-binding domain-containing protein, partial [Bacillus velezensis]|nr:LysR substrate-binding domain-containing protein [Bacillus velezensis]